MKKLKTGWKPNKPDPRDYTWGETRRTKILRTKLKKIGDIPDSFELPVPFIFSQSHNDCGANAAVLALAISDVARGRKIEPRLFSRRALHWFARRRNSWLDTQRNTGIHPRHLWEHLRRLGIPLEEAWPYDKKLRKRPSIDAMRSGVIRKMGEYYAVDTKQNIQEALLTWHPVCLGVYVDNAFGNHNGITPWERSGKIRGGHYIVCNGWYTTDLGETVWRIVNSWGWRWADAGRGVITSKAMEDAGDRTAVQGWRSRNGRKK